MKTFAGTILYSICLTTLPLAFCPSVSNSTVATIGCSNAIWCALTTQVPPLRRFRNSRFQHLAISAPVACLVRCPLSPCHPVLRQVSLRRVCFELFDRARNHPLDEIFAFGFVLHQELSEALFFPVHRREFQPTKAWGSVLGFQSFLYATPQERRFSVVPFVNHLTRFGFGGVRSVWINVNRLVFLESINSHPWNPVTGRGRIQYQTSGSAVHTPPVRLEKPADGPSNDG